MLLFSTQSTFVFVTFYAIRTILDETRNQNHRRKCWKNVFPASPITSVIFFDLFDTNVDINRNNRKITVRTRAGCVLNNYIKNDLYFLRKDVERKPNTRVAHN